MSVDKVLNFAAEGFGEADNHIDLGFAQVILFLLIKLHHVSQVDKIIVNPALYLKTNIEEE